MAVATLPLPVEAPGETADRPNDPASREAIALPDRIGFELRRNSPLARILDLLANPEERPGIAGCAYDTAWLAGVPSEANPHESQYPSCLQWLVDHQLPDGSWGGVVCYEHDRILSTLAALAPLARFGHRGDDHDAVAAGTRYLWQHGHRLSIEPIELVGFELLLPTLIKRAQDAGLRVPPHLDVYRREREKKLSLIPPQALYSPKATIVHSLEFLGDEADVAGLKAAQGPNGSIGNSPAATAFLLARGGGNASARAYLDSCLNRVEESMAPVLHPCETFELMWAAYHLFLGGVPTSLIIPQPEIEGLLAALTEGGVSLSSPTFPIPDADDTAVALLLLQHLGHDVDPSVLAHFASRDGSFASFPHERHSSVGVNLHVLHALLRVRGYPNCEQTVERILDYLADQQVSGLYWLDKWHISPYYATAHALCVLAELPEAQARRVRPMVERSRQWLRETQNADGSWGFCGQPTPEETAYAVLALAARDPGGVDDADRRCCALAGRYLRRAMLNTSRWDPEQMYPPLWIDKCLYTPTLVVRAAIEAASFVCARVQHSKEELARV
jgi:halimadienyl-diphosphate synthase